MCAIKKNKKKRNRLEFAIIQMQMTQKQLATTADTLDEALEKARKEGEVPSFFMYCVARIIMTVNIFSANTKWFAIMYAYEYQDSHKLSSFIKQTEIISAKFKIKMAELNLFRNEMACSEQLLQLQ